MHMMTFDAPNDVGALASEVPTAAQTVSSGNNSTGSPVDVAGSDQQRPKREYPVTAMALSEPDAADSSNRSLRFRNVFSRSRNNDISGSKRGSFVSSIRSSIRSSFASGDFSDDDSLEAEHHGLDDLTPPGQQPRSSGRRRSSLLKKRFSRSRRNSAFSSRSSIGSSGSGSKSSKRPSAVNRKSSLDLIRASEGEYRPRAEHPLLTDNPPTEDKTKRRGSFLNAAMRKLIMTGSANINASASSNHRAQLNKTKSAGALESAATSVTPLSSSDHGPQPRQRKSSFFGNLCKGSSDKHVISEDEDPTQNLSLSNHF